MQSQPQTYRIRLNKSKIYDAYRRGSWGEPTIYRPETLPEQPLYFGNFPHSIGDVLRIVDEETKAEFLYVLKELKDGWWKLEWPD